jgi:uncharacterized protein YutE (UPF0331/DUF86 family)
MRGSYGFAITGYLMVDPGLIASKLAELSDRVARVTTRCPPTIEELRDDRDALDVVSFNLMLAVQSCADIASHIIADEGWPAAGNLAGAFNRLRDEGVITADTAAALCRAVGLRNVVAHGDSGINPAMVHDAATRGVADLEAFAQEVAAWIAPREEGC